MITYPVSTKNAAIITGISPQALRTYTRRYSRFLSLEATPDAGQERRFTEADLRTDLFVFSSVANSEQISDRSAGSPRPIFAPSSLPTASPPPAAPTKRL